MTVLSCSGLPSPLENLAAASMHPCVRRGHKERHSVDLPTPAGIAPDLSHQAYCTDSYGASQVDTSTR
jgi:hypothetical protein